MTTFAHRELSRKTFLKGGGAFVLGFSMLDVGLAAKAQADSNPYPFVDPSQLDSWLGIDSTGKVTVFTGRVDQGQGKETSYAQTVAEELGVAFDHVKVVMGDTARTPNQGKSTATNGITTGLPPLRNAAAQARGTLLALAAAQLGVPVAGLTVNGGVVSVVANPSQTVSYAALVGGKRFNVTMPVTGSTAGNAEPGFPYPALSGATTNLNVTPSYPLKDPGSYSIVGTSVARVDIPAKVTGTYTYTQNIRIPGMVHARMVLPPFSASYPKVVPQLLAVKGFRTPQPGVQIVQKGNFVAVVAAEEYKAIEGASQLITEWAEDPKLPNLGNINAVMRSTPNNSFTPQNGGAVTGGGFNPAAGTVMSARYDFPFTNHGMIGPSNAVADWNQSTGSVVVWTGMQNPVQVQAETASLLGISPKNVRVIWVEQSSMFGRGGVDDVAPGAAFISQQIGKPVRLQWMRHDENVWSPTMPGTTQDLKATLGSNGLVTSWFAESWAPVAGWDVGYNLPSVLLGSSSGLPHGATAAATPGIYAVPASQTIAHSIDPPVRPMYMRTVQGLQNTFISESFWDELASAAGVDSIQFRLNHLTNQANQLTGPSIGVLQAIQAMSGWQSRPSPLKGQTGPVMKGRGIGLTPSTSCTIAHACEVEVTRKTGAVKVTKIWVAAQLGTLVNPDSVRAQIEGGTIMGLSRALKDEVTFGKKVITSRDWVSYPIARFKDLPATIDIEILKSAVADNGSIASWTKIPNGGIGEPSTINVPAAVANAVFDATGVRIRSTPFRPARVLSALKTAGIA
ncbi:MAG TPA: molybdopterin cofactor-binding domain-containing protein [Gaiellaceae bacterium]|jgi:CO/xanthine dehydrogenase Mo-binding subunit